jgi:DUF1365 family protein
MTLGVVARIHWQALQAVAQAREVFPQACRHLTSFVTR